MYFQQGITPLILAAYTQLFWHLRVRENIF
jgi:hypothetical protein